MTRRLKSLVLAFALPFLAVAYAFWPTDAPVAGQGGTVAGRSEPDVAVGRHARDLISEGRRVFRYDTFGDEAFWGDALRLHRAIAGAALGGVGPGVSPRTALAVGLKVDVDALPRPLLNQLARGEVDLENPATTLALLRLNSVVGVTGFFDERGGLRSMGIQCAFCHSTVDDSFATGIGHRLDGWANRDLNVGAIVGLAPNLDPVTDLLGVDEATVRAVLASWGPGRFDAELFLDGKAFSPDGRSASTLIPPAFGLAGVNLHTWTGWGSVTHWNAFVAVLEMHGKGTFFDPRLDDPVRFPVAARAASAMSATTPTWSRPSWRHSISTSSPSPLPPRRTGRSTARPPLEARRCSTARRTARAATCRPCSPSRAGTCTRERRSGSTTSRPTVRPTGATAHLPSRASGRTRRADFSMTAGSRHCRPWSPTTTPSSCWA